MTAAANQSFLQSQFSQFEDARQQVRRCTRCVLPETMPFISFDSEGVCSHCHQYTNMQVRGKEAALAHVQQMRLPEAAPNCLLMLSGGRDSCYGLHYAVTELGLKPLAYTYDWGMGTDLCMRNAITMCKALGVEHVVVRANAKHKLANVRKNIQAWLKQPELGMVPLFMAGDKQYFLHANNLAKKHGFALTLVAENPMEASRFKAGFCGIDESNHRIYDIPLYSKFLLASYYARQMLKNPAYINTSLLDSASAFACSYFLKHEYMQIFHYTLWEEDTVNNTLINQYGWETDPEAASTWRIGDGTSAFYNYIYYVMAGLTENDVLRSRQIREGMLTRQEALDRVVKENQPRWQSLGWYALTVGFDLGHALGGIHTAPRLY